MRHNVIDTLRLNPLPRRFAAACSTALLAAGLFAASQPSLPGAASHHDYVVETYYANPHAAETLVSFDWDAAGRLYYSTGRPNWGLGFSVYQRDGATLTLLHEDNNVFAGPWVTVIGNSVYFNDGGNFARWTSDYFKFTPATAAPPVRIIDSAASGTDLWGLHGRNGILWAAGGWSSTLYYTPLDRNGVPVILPPIALGAIGESSGPMAFDVGGNLFYAQAYVAAGVPRIYRWPVAAVRAAIANPSGRPLTPAGYEWATITGGFTGATGMAIDHNGHLILTVTAFNLPGEVRRYFRSRSGANNGWETLAISPDRPETVRVARGSIFFSSSQGIYRIRPAPVNVGSRMRTRFRRFLRSQRPPS